MDLLAGTKTVLHLKDIANGSPVALTLNGSDLRFICMATSNLTEVARWSVRNVEETITFTIDDTIQEITLDNVSDATKLRDGEIIELFGSGTYFGTILVREIDEIIGVIKYDNVNANDVDFSTADSLVLRKDPFLLDGFTKPINSFDFPLLVVESTGACELGIERIISGNFI